MVNTMVMLIWNLNARHTFYRYANSAPSFGGTSSWFLLFVFVQQPQIHREIRRRKLVSFTGLWCVDDELSYARFLEKISLSQGEMRGSWSRFRWKVVGKRRRYKGQDNFYHIIVSLEIKIAER